MIYNIESSDLPRQDDVQCGSFRLISTFIHPVNYLLDYDTLILVRGR